MTRKDFAMIAQAFKAAADTARKAQADLGAFIALDDCASRIAVELARGNPRFDREKFVRACSIVARRAEPLAITGYDEKPLTQGQRVELHPSLDLWMKGAHFGDLIVIRDDGTCLVKLDHVAGARIFNPTQLRSA